jgi:hypothetical protein
MNFYSLNPAIYKVSSNRANRTAATPMTLSTGDNSFTGAIYFDWLNKKVLMVQQNAVTNSIDHITQYNEDMQGGTRLLTITSGFHISFGSITGFLAAHPENSHVYYPGLANGTSTPSLLRRVDYNGANDQTIVSFTSPAGGLTSLELIIVSKAEEYVFYSRRDADGGTINVEFHRCNADGSGDITLFRDTSAPGTPRSIAIDNVNKVVFWSDSASGGRGSVYRFDFAGNNRSTILDASTLTHPSSTASYQFRLAGYSHANQRLYIFAGSNTGVLADMGMWSLKADGSDFKPEWVWPNIDGDDATDLLQQHPRLGCGFDKTGPATLAS